MLFPQTKPEHIVETKKWIEYHENGTPWITGEIAILNDEFKHLYDYRMQMEGYENIPVARIGIWTKHYDNEQLAWTLDMGNGILGCKKEKPYPQYRRDGSIIQY